MYYLYFIPLLEGNKLQISKYLHDSSPHYDDQPSPANMDNVSELFQLSQPLLSTAYKLKAPISNVALVTKSSVMTPMVGNKLKQWWSCSSCRITRVSSSGCFVWLGCAGLVGAAHAGWNVSIISSARGWLMAPAQPSPAQPRPLPTFIQIVKKKAGGEAHFRLPDFSLQHCSITAHCRVQLEDCLHFIIVDSLQQPCVGRSYFTPLCFLEAGGPILPWSWQNLSRQWVDTDWDRTSASVMWCEYLLARIQQPALTSRVTDTAAA